jgi:transposase-like protein
MTWRTAVSRWPADYRLELEAFWRSHHEAWRRSDLNQREYCEAQGLPLKRFGNWRAKFKAEPEVPEKLLYRRGGALRPMSKWARHMSNEVGPPQPDPAKTVAGRRTFSEEEKRRIVDEASQPGVSLSQVARRYGIYRRLLFRWREELRPKPEQTSTPPVFAPVQVLDAAPDADSSVVPSTPGIEIELVGGRRARFERDADPETVRQLVALLEGSTP